MFSSISSFLGAYRWFFIAGIALLVAGLIIVSRSMHGKTGKENHEEAFYESVKEEKVQVKLPEINLWPYVAGLLLLLAIGVGVYFIIKNWARLTVFFGSYFGLYVPYVITGFVLLAVIILAIRFSNRDKENDKELKASARRVSPSRPKPRKKSKRK